MCVIEHEHGFRLGRSALMGIQLPTDYCGFLYKITQMHPIQTDNTRGDYVYDRKEQ